MSNPMNKMRNKHFLKKERSIEDTPVSRSQHTHLLSHRAVAIKERIATSPSPQRKSEQHEQHRRFVSTGVDTDDKA